METQEQLKLLRKKLEQKELLEGEIARLYEQKSRFDRNVISLQVAYRQEQEDADRLDRKSAVNFLHNMMGKLEEKQEKERREAKLAKEKLSAAEWELEQISQKICAVQTQLAELHTVQQQYQALLQERYLFLKGSGTQEGEQILRMEQCVKDLENRKREIQEAISAGNRARGTAHKILSELEDADNWNTWDLIGGGGILTHVAKHGHLDEAQDLVGVLKGNLRQFKTELADIQISADIQVNAEGFERFADWFFDGLFVDWAMGEKISASVDSVTGIRDQISRIMDRLGEMEQSVNQEIAKKKAQLEELVTSL